MNDRDAGGKPGWGQVLAVAGAVVALVLGAAVLTSFLPASIQEVVFHTPVAIAVLLAGTGLVLWQIARQGPGGSSGSNDPDTRT